MDEIIRTFCWMFETFLAYEVRESISCCSILCVWWNSLTAKQMHKDEHEKVFHFQLASKAFNFFFTSIASLFLFLVQAFILLIFFISSNLTRKKIINISYFFLLVLLAFAICKILFSFGSTKVTKMVIYNLLIDNSFVLFVSFVNCVLCCCFLLFLWIEIGGKICRKILIVREQR